MRVKWAGVGLGLPALHCIVALADTALEAHWGSRDT